MPRWTLIENRFARCCTNNLPSARRQFSCSRAWQKCYRVHELLEQRSQLDNVEVNGWIRSIRKQKRVAFIALTDGSGSDNLQAVLTPEQGADLAHGAAVNLKGQWVRSSGKNQANELQVSSILSLGQNDAETNPIQPKYQTTEHLRSFPHLRTQVPQQALVLQLRSQLVALITQWFYEQGFVQCHTPIITSSDCEGAGEVFSVLTDEELAMKGSSELQPFFRAQKYLTVSAQLHLEALAQAVSKVWTLSPTFRAEKSDTQRHLSEFYMLEAEVCFANNLEGVMSVLENLLRFVAGKLSTSAVMTQLVQAKQSKQSETDMIDLEQRLTGLKKPNWPRLTYSDAIKYLLGAHESGEHTFEIAPSLKHGLAAEHERFIASRIGQGAPVFVTNYPIEQKPFYMLDAGDGTAECFDLLVPDLCELAGGSLREHRLDRLEAALDRKGVSAAGLEWYKDLRRYGSVPHGGFGLGFDRLVCYLAGVGNVKDVVSFPRYYGRCDC